MEQQQLFEQMLAQHAGNNPQFQAMLALMQQAQAAKNEAKSGSGPEQELSVCKNRLTKAVSKIRQLSAEAEEMRETLDAWERFQEDMANALGACSFCWGEDAACRACRGKGKPGAFEPDPVLFEKFVLPALQKSKAHLQ